MELMREMTDSEQEKRDTRKEASIILQNWKPWKWYFLPYFGTPFRDNAKN